MGGSYYVYVYLNPLEPGDFQAASYSFVFRPFYVGKGRGRRLYDHLAEAGSPKSATNPAKSKIIADLLRNSTSPYVLKLQDSLNERQALALERQLIEDLALNSVGGVLANMRLGETPKTWSSTAVKFVYLAMLTERDRISAQADQLMSSIQELPDGSIQEKRRHNKSYSYLAKRTENGVKFGYIARSDSEKARRW